jgi:hypothetical protein
MSRIPTRFPARKDFAQTEFDRIHLIFLNGSAKSSVFRKKR